MGSNTAHAALLGPRQPIDALAGETLARRLERHGRLPALDALRIAAQLATLLAGLHARGAVHRALTPHNVFLARDAEAAGGERVELLEPATSGDPITSSPLYASPEQCRGTGDIDHRADIYALGCLLYHLLIGRPPFVADAHGAVLAMHLYETPTPPSIVLPFLGGAIDGVVMRCLAKPAAERHERMSDVADEIERLLASNELAIPPFGVDLAAVSNRWQLAGVVAATAEGSGTRALAPAPASTLRRWRHVVVALAVAVTAAVLVALARWF